MFVNIVFLNKFYVCVSLYVVLGACVVLGPGACVCVFHSEKKMFKAGVSALFLVLLILTASSYDFPPWVRDALLNQLQGHKDGGNAAT